MLMLSFGIASVAQSKEKGIWFQKNINTQTCAIYQFPLNEKGNYTKRGQVLFYVFKEEGAFYVRGDAGYVYDSNKRIKTTILVGDEKKNFQFFEDGEYAWSMQDDRLIINEMKAGREMIVVGFSSRGTETTDTYSLIGFTKAFNRLNESC